jgi:NAD+ kinase
MNDGARLVGVVGDPPADLTATIADVADEVRRGDVESVLSADPGLVVAVGASALLGLARTAPAAPILPVDADRGFRSVAPASLAAAVEHALDERVETVSCPVLEVTHDGEHVGRAVADVSLLTAEVAHISEYALTADGTEVAQFRADGVVVATPAGSPGYARRIDCPVVAPGTGVAAVAPIAPFATDPDHWVLPLADLLLTVERDETDVTLLADDRDVATVGRGEPVRISRDGTADIAVVPESESHY